MSSRSFRTVYFPYMHSTMSYGRIFGGNWPYSNSFTDSKKNNKNYYACWVQHPLFNILPLHPQYIFLLSTFVVKNIVASKANSAIHSINTEQGFDLHPPTPNLTKAQKAVYYCRIKIFSNLPLNIKHLSNVTNKFKSALIKFLLASVLTDHTCLWL
jgi:hypothetical protein